MGFFFGQRWIALVGSAALCLAAACSAAGQEHYEAFDSAGIELLMPDRFERAGEFDGVTNPDSGASVMVTVIPGPYAATTAGMTDAAFEKEGLRVTNRAPVTIAGKEGLLITGMQTDEGVEFHKLIALFGDETTTMVVGVYPSAVHDEFGENVRAIVLSARPVAGSTKPAGDVAPFTLGSRDKLSLAHQANNMVIFTKDGTIPIKSPSDPMFVAGKSMSESGRRVRDMRNYSQARMQRTAEFRLARVRSHEPVTVDDLQGFESLANGQDTKTGALLTLYQLMLFEDSGHYYLMQGMIGRADEEEYLPVFQAIAHGFERTEEGRASSQQAGSLATSSKPQEEARQRNRSTRRERPRPEPVMNAAPVKALAATLPRAEEKLPTFRYRPQHVTTSDAVGEEEEGAEKFDDRAPGGGVLAGLQVVKGTNWGGAVVAVEPIFQVGDRYESAGVHGASEGESHVLLAPRGHAVGGVQIRAGLVMDAVRLAYMPVKGRQLDPDKVTYSDWIGGTGGNEAEIMSDGSIVVGLAGTHDGNLMSLRLHTIEPSRVRAVSERPANEADQPTAAKPRTWKSAGSKFTVEAALESFDGTQVVLVKADGKKVRVPADKLSAADRTFLKRWQRENAAAGEEASQ